MFRVIAYSDYKKEDPIIIHEPAKYGNKILKGEIEQEINTVHTFDFTIAQNNTYYRNFSLLNTIISVVDLNTNKVEFEGRVADENVKMSNKGDVGQTILAEDKLAYLHDSSQEYMKTTLMDTPSYFKRLIDIHNKQVEPHKRFTVRNITVDTNSGKVYRSIGYADTFDTIKDKLIDRLGGYLVYEEVNGVLYLDYLEKLGEVSSTPIQLARNLKDASKNTTPDELATVIVPLGAEVERNHEETEAEKADNDFSIERITIASVNNNSIELVDEKLVKQFGRIRKSIEFPNTTNKNILKSQGQNYLKNQRVLLIAWEVGVVEIGLIDERYELFKLGNYHTVYNPLLSDNEQLQIVAKKLNVIYPQSTTLKIGNQKKTLSQYQNQLGSQQKPIEAMKDRLKTNSFEVQEVKSSSENQKQEITRVEGIASSASSDANSATLVAQNAEAMASQLDKDMKQSNAQLQQQIDELKELINKEGKK